MNKRMELEQAVTRATALFKTSECVEIRRQLGYAHLVASVIAKVAKLHFRDGFEELVGKKSGQTVLEQLPRFLLPR